MSDIKRGDLFVRLEPAMKEPVKVMAVADSYAMVRYARCMPFAVYEKDLLRDWFRVDPPKRGLPYTKDNDNG